MVKNHNPQNRGEDRSGILFLTTGELASKLNVPSSRMIDEMRHRGAIPFLRLGHRTVRFQLDRVLSALERLEVRAIG